MPMLKFMLCISLAGLATFAANAGHSQTYPSKAIRIVTVLSGGNADFFARLLGQEITGPLGQAVVVENRAGVIAADTVKGSAPDGYTLLAQGPAFWIAPLLQKLSYDPVKDYAPITIIARAPNILLVHPSVAAKSVPELIALAKAKPGVLNYGSGVTGSSDHLSAELFKSLTGVNLVRDPYKGTPVALNGLLGAEVQVSITPATLALPHVKSGRLRALGVTSAEPSRLVPGVPTIASTVPGYESALTTAMFAPAKTPAAIINRLNQEFVRTLRMPGVIERVLMSGAEPVGSTPEQLGAAVRSEMTRMAKVIKDADIKAE